MFATNAVSSILGVRPDQIKDKSFYECMQENDLSDAIRCLETAKANDSIAYLRFWYRDPRRPEDFDDETDENDETDEENQSENSSDSEDGGVKLNEQLDGHVDIGDAGQQIKQEEQVWPKMAALSSATHTATTEGSILSSRSQHTAATSLLSIDDVAAQPSSSAARLRDRHRKPSSAFELEAMVLCTLDGLVVVIRKPPFVWGTAADRREKLSRRKDGAKQN
ncbi:hypothetical protein ColTof4_12182 [Colletotrichum tofieldiae]|nr:hypothetical protein ColTof3_05594 [Colletotrichum tofieldiae]GKT79759.1 hypothetical protein ColTof4_12182 [Colletotrichum tofieldiae]